MVSRNPGATLKRRWGRLAERGEKVDIFFLDPPYREGLYNRCFALIRAYDLLADEGIIVAEHGERDDFPKPMRALKN